MKSTSGLNQNAPLQQLSGVLLEPSANDQLTSAPSIATEEPTNDDLMEMLYSRLERRGLRAVETEGDGNCFFRAVSRMVYGTDKYYSMKKMKMTSEISSWDHFQVRLGGRPQDKLPQENILTIFVLMGVGQMR